MDGQRFHPRGRMGVKTEQCERSLKSLGCLTGCSRGEWPSSLNCFRQVTEVQLGRVRSNSGWMTSKAFTSQLTLSSFGKDVKLGVQCLDEACIVGLY